MAVLLETTLGDIVVDLYTEERPKASLNFLKLCKIKYYNYCLIHNVQRDFIIQTGDPTGTGRGGESVFCKLYGDQARFFESEKMPRIKHRKKGTVSMVTEGMDVLAKINETFVDDDFIPFQDIRINHTVILDDPFDDPAGLTVPDRSPEPTKEQLDSGRIGADEAINDDEGRDAEELDELIKDKEAKTQAILLEMVGDLPDADVKPPENVLFVCKLNPVTTDEDLEIIFSRFGSIKCCEIIRDWKSGESLCYAFIEFEKEEDCEKAYFKMDNVLIDDRRIHVDFSQSVSKIKWKGKGGKYTKEDFKAYEKELDNKSKLALKDKIKSKQEYPSFSPLNTSLVMNFFWMKMEMMVEKRTEIKESENGVQTARETKSESQRIVMKVGKTKADIVPAQESERDIRSESEAEKRRSTESEIKAGNETVITNVTGESEAEAQKDRNIESDTLLRHRLCLINLHQCVWEGDGTNV
ncbi:hypothetical protein DNTS_032416 [Danionella cerebrum]|uniref:Peptidyl-prolyl cis-trans isomerase n=1 Tax=Danionella cerebrum TaxID=2873325 RepID=A0A553N156_9TELE|nr:hypothetical protein DNTS_032416 [Danionella translucida]